MTVSELKSNLGLNEVTNCSNLEKYIEGCYISDLLSLAMGKVQENDAWITVQTNINIVAIAVLTELAVIIIAENMHIDQSVIDKANEEDVCILKSDKSAYEIAIRIGNLL